MFLDQRREELQAWLRLVPLPKLLPCDGLPVFTMFLAVSAACDERDRL